MELIPNIFSGEQTKHCWGCVTLVTSVPQETSWFCQECLPLLQQQLLLNWFAAVCIFIFSCEMLVLDHLWRLSWSLSYETFSHIFSKIFFQSICRIMFRPDNWICFSLYNPVKVHKLVRMNLHNLQSLMNSILIGKTPGIVISLDQSGPKGFSGPNILNFWKHFCSNLLKFDYWGFLSTGLTI